MSGGDGRRRYTHTRCVRVPRDERRCARVLGATSERAFFHISGPTNLHLERKRIRCRRQSLHLKISGREAVSSVDVIPCRCRDLFVGAASFSSHGILCHFRFVGARKSCSRPAFYDSQNPDGVWEERKRDDSLFEKITVPMESTKS